VEATNANIVLSTYWRIHVDYIKEIFGHSKLVSPDRVIGITCGSEVRDVWPPLPENARAK